MDERQQMRASDRDREEVVGRLRAALDEGRLKMPEYVERMGLAYDAVTYADLAPLHADIPAAVLARPPEAAPAAPEPSCVFDARPQVQHVPTALKVLWTIWLTIVSINVVVWVLVTVTRGHLVYPWPLWVAGPAGAALFGVTFGVSQIRRSHQPGPEGLPPGPGPSGPPR